MSQDPRITKPPLYEFDTRDDLEQTLRRWAFEQGFALSLRSSGDSYCYLICDRENRGYAAHNQSKKTGCTFRIYIHLKDGFWRNVDTDGIHSQHSFVENLAAHATFRRWWSLDHSQEIHSLCASGQTSRDILKTLRVLYPSRTPDALDISACPLLYDELSNWKRDGKKFRQMVSARLTVYSELLKLEQIGSTMSASMKITL
ncbi:hypothetical protein GEMRC1_003560 [Eukaryota sp. GEM-RC1]